MQWWAQEEPMWGLGEAEAKFTAMVGLFPARVRSTGAALWGGSDIGRGTEYKAPGEGQGQDRQGGQSTGHQGKAGDRTGRGAGQSTRHQGKAKDRTGVGDRAQGTKGRPGQDRLGGTECRAPGEGQGQNGGWGVGGN